MKRWARRSKSLIIAFKIFHNWQMRRRFASGRIESEHGSSHSRKSLAESLAYIEEQFRDYLTYGQLDLDLARNGAPLLAFGNLPSRDFFSVRIGCQTYNAYFGMDLAALCLRHAHAG